MRACLAVSHCSQTGTGYRDGLPGRVTGLGYWDGLLGFSKLRMRGTSMQWGTGCGARCRFIKPGCVSVNISSERERKDSSEVPCHQKAFPVSDEHLEDPIDDDYCTKLTQVLAFSMRNCV